MIYHDPEKFDFDETLVKTMDEDIRSSSNTSMPSTRFTSMPKPSLSHTAPSFSSFEQYNSDEAHARLMFGLEINLKQLHTSTNSNQYLQLVHLKSKKRVTSHAASKVNKVTRCSSESDLYIGPENSTPVRSGFKHKPAPDTDSGNDTYIYDYVSKENI